MSAGGIFTVAPAATACLNAASQSAPYSQKPTGAGVAGDGGCPVIPGISSFMKTTEFPMRTAACQTELPSGAGASISNSAPSPRL